MSTGTHMRRPPSQIILLLIFVLVVATYWPGMTGGFLFDDFPNIVDNPALRVSWQSSGIQWLAAAFSSPSEELLRPLAMVSFAFNHAATGMDPYWMKVTNLAIHLVNTALIFLLISQISAVDALGRDAISTAKAVWVSAAWALNPINITAVLLIVQRMEILCHTFVLAGLCIYLDGRCRMQRGRPGAALAGSGLLIGTSLGWLAKESAALLPLYAFLTEVFLLRFTTARQSCDRRLLAAWLAGIGALAIGAAAWLLPRVLLPEAFANRDFTMTQRLLTEGRVLVDYLQWTLAPRLGELGFYHDDLRPSLGWLQPPGTLVAWCLLAGLASCALVLRNRRPLASLGIAWFLAAHAMTATVIPLELVFEHRNYFASLGLMLAVADVLAALANRFSRPTVPVAFALLLLVLYGGTTTLRAREWSNPLRFALSEADRHPESPRAAYEAARAYVIADSLAPEARLTELAEAAIRRSMAVPGASPLPTAAAILLASRKRKPIDPRWWSTLRIQLSQTPYTPQNQSALESLVKCDVNGRCRLPKEQMVNTMLTVLAAHPRADVMYVYGDYALNVLHDPHLALQLWTDAATTSPNEFLYTESLVRLLLATGDFSSACEQIWKAEEQAGWQEKPGLAELKRTVPCPDNR